MRHILSSLALASFLAISAPIAAQGVSDPATIALHQRAKTLDQHIDAAVRTGRLSRSKATALHTAVGRVHTAAGNYEARNGTVPATEINRLDRQLSAVEAALPGMPAGRQANRQATSDMRSRLAAADERIVSAQRHGKLPAPRAALLRRQVADAQQNMARLSGRQEFVSAGELASYGRLVASVDAELSANASGRPYGNDMLPAREQSYGNDALPAGEHHYGNDALPSTEVMAFQKMDARLHYRDARIERDAKGCAVYQGTAPSGQVRRELLGDRTGRPICSRR